jgi:hypothetical protein
MWQTAPGRKIKSSMDDRTRGLEQQLLGYIPPSTDDELSQASRLVHKRIRDESGVAEICSILGLPA